MGQQRKTGLPSFHKELEKLLGDKAKPPKVPPTNVVKPIPMPMIDLASKKDYTALAQFENGVLKIPAGALDMENIVKLLNEWKKSNAIVLDTLGQLIVNVEETPDGAYLISTQKPKPYKLSKEPKEIAEKALFVPDPLVEQLQQELESTFQSLMGLKVTGVVHDEITFEKTMLNGIWDPPMLSDAATKQYVSGKAQGSGTFKAYQNPEQDFGQNPCKEIFLKETMKETAEKVEASKQAMMNNVTFDQVFGLKQQHVPMGNYAAQELAYAAMILQKQTVLTEVIQGAEDTLFNILKQTDAPPINEKVPVEEVEVVELTLSGLTRQEADEVLKNYGKTKEGKNLLVHKTVRKELGSKSEPVVVWPFESSSMQVNGEPILYKAQLNKDGTLSCNCMGWTMGSAKSSGGRRCKHTDNIEVEAQTIYKKWKKGESLGENYEMASSSVASASSKTLFKALKEDAGDGSSGVFKAKRIVEI